VNYNLQSLHYYGTFNKWPTQQDFENLEVFTTATKNPIFCREDFLKNIGGSLKINNTEIQIPQLNYTISHLNSILPSNIKIKTYKENFIVIKSKDYYACNENLKVSLVLDNNYLYSHTGLNTINTNFTSILPQVFEMHCIHTNFLSVLKSFENICPSVS